MYAPCLALGIVGELPVGSRLREGAPFRNAATGRLRVRKRSPGVRKHPQPTFLLASDIARAFLPCFGPDSYPSESVVG
jgi:hypothetical protein